MILSMLPRWCQQVGWPVCAFLWLLLSVCVFSMCAVCRASLPSLMAGCQCLGLCPHLGGACLLLVGQSEESSGGLFLVDGDRSSARAASFSGASCILYVAVVALFHTVHYRIISVQSCLNAFGEFCQQVINKDEEEGQ